MTYTQFNCSIPQNTTNTNKPWHPVPLMPGSTLSSLKRAVRELAPHKWTDDKANNPFKSCPYQLSSHSSDTPPPPLESLRSCIHLSQAPPLLLSATFTKTAARSAPKTLHRSTPQQHHKLARY
jgi:hypothetical protein